MPIFKTKKGKWKVQKVKYPEEGFKTKKEAIKQLQAIQISKKNR